MYKIGIVTIGQSPRDDAASQMRRYLTHEAQILQRGALDDLDPEAVAALRPKEGQHTLVTKLRDGSEVKVAHEEVVPRMQKAVDALVEEGAELIVLWCTGDFPMLQAERPILRPGKLLRAVLTALAGEARLGVVVPSAEQVPIGQQQLAGLDVVVTHASPYAASETWEEAWRRAARELNASGVDLVYLDCMGMDEGAKSIVRQVTHKPVVLASSVVSRIVDELIAQDRWC